MTESARPSLLVNPRSFRASRQGMARRASELARTAGLEVYEVFDPPTLRERMEQLRARGVQQIWILAGDGILQALAEYFAQAARNWSPALLFLAGGRANVVPRETGGYPAMPALRRALTALREGRPLIEERMVTLQVSQPGQPVRQGFVWGAAMVQEAVRLTAESRAKGRGWWRHSWFADPFVLLRWAFRTMVLRQPLPDFPKVVARLSGMGELAGRPRILVASTLEMRAALYNPFASRGAGPVRFTAVSAAGPLIRDILPALRKGRFDDSMDIAHGILSGRGAQVELLGVADYALDGELFRADPSQPLTLSAGVQLRVLRPGA